MTFPVIVDAAARERIRPSLDESLLGACGPSDERPHGARASAACVVRALKDVAGRRGRFDKLGVANE